MLDHYRDSFETVLIRMQKGAGVRTQTELARILEIGKAAISDAKRRRAIPAEWFVKLARAPFFLNPGWLETGVGLQCIPTDMVAERPGQYGGGAELMNVPFLGVGKKNGGALVVDDSVRCGMAFTKSWLETLGAPEHLCLAPVYGDNMAPTLVEGDITLVDQSEVDMSDGKIYAVRIDDEIIIRRAAKVPGAYALVSDNSEQSPPIVLNQSSGDVQTLGRVVWGAREYR